MKVYFSVTVAFYDNGTKSAHITGTKASERKPETSFKTSNGIDVYTYWFDSYEEASEFAENAKKAKGE